MATPPYIQLDEQGTQDQHEVGPTHAYPPQQPQSIVITQPVYVTTHYPSYRGKFAKILGITQISAGILSIIFNIIGIRVDAGSRLNYFSMFYMVPGIWCGIFVSSVIDRGKHIPPS